MAETEQPEFIRGIVQFGALIILKRNAVLSSVGWFSQKVCRFCCCDISSKQLCVVLGSWQTKKDIGL